MALVHNMHSIPLNQDRLVYLEFCSIYCSGGVCTINKVAGDIRLAFPFYCDAAILLSDRSQADLWNCSLADVSGGAVITQRNFAAKLTVWADCIIIDCFGNSSFVCVIQPGKFNISQFCPFGDTFPAAVDAIAVGTRNFVHIRFMTTSFWGFLTAGRLSFAVPVRPLVLYLL